jgi:HEAT repeat-containing protein 5
LPADLAPRAMGRAYALSALIAAVPDRPLYVSYDISTTVMDTAIGLLKRAGDHDVKVAEIEVQVAWTLIGSLMTLGASFVKMHLPQLLVLWRNALPKPTSKDSSVGERGEKEWLFLLQVRECALSAILSFLRNNPSKDVVTLDVARRIAALLTNTLNFINGFASAYAEALRELQAAQMQQQQGGTSNNPAAMTFASAAGRATLADRENLLRRRILQCFTALGSSSATESSQPALVMAAVGAIADPDNAVVSANATQAAIQASAGGFTSVWQSIDMYGFGVTSLEPTRPTVSGSADDLNRDSIEMAIELQVTRSNWQFEALHSPRLTLRCTLQLSNPLLASLEHDTLGLTIRAKADTSHDVCPTSVSAASGVIDAGVELFAILLPHQTVDTMIQSVTLMTNHLRSPTMERSPGRRQAVLFNVLVALSRALAFAQSAGSRKASAFSNTNVVTVIRALLQEGVLDSSKQLRAAASEAMGSLASLVGGNYLSQQSQWLVDQIVNNRVPDSRAGCALGLAAIYSQVGGLLAAPLLKTIVSVLMSLSTDPHPTVHFWAMSSLSRVIDSASLAYSPYVTSTLKMVANIYMLETHEPEGGSVGSTNLRGDLPAYQEMCRILHGIIGVMGPELQEPSTVKTMTLLLVHEFGLEPDEGLAVEAMRCFQQILMFVPNDMDVPGLVSTFRSHLGSKRRPLKVAAITALYQIVQRDAVLMSKLGGNQLVEDLFALLDEDPSMEGVRQVIISWLQQTSAALPSGWIDLCQRIMNRPANNAGAVAAATNIGLQDDEGQSLGGDSSALLAAVTSRWRTQLFALQCLHEVIQAVVRAGRPEHFDAALARSLNINPRQLIISRVSDLIRMAFSAATAQTMEVRMQGLVVLRDVVEVSGLPLMLFGRPGKAYAHIFS